MVETDVAIIGGGPAGMVAGLLFARAGVKTLVLEKHADFLRDFRGGYGASFDTQDLP